VLRNVEDLVVVIDSQLSRGTRFYRYRYYQLQWNDISNTKTVYEIWTIINAVLWEEIDKCVPHRQIS